MIKATEKFPGGGGIWSPGMDLRWGISTAFRPWEGAIWTKIFQKFKYPGVCPRGDDEASIWLVHNGHQHGFDSGEVGLYLLFSCGHMFSAVSLSLWVPFRWKVVCCYLQLPSWSWLPEWNTILRVISSFTRAKTRFSCLMFRETYSFS